MPQKHIYKYGKGFHTFLLRQYHDINRGGWPIFRRKVSRLFFLPLALFFLCVMRLLRPWVLIRINSLLSHRIGHFAANTELYLCERDAGINVPKRRYVDLCYFAGNPLANKQLALMWDRCLRIWPESLLGPVVNLNKLFPGSGVHDVGNNTQNDRDVHDLLGRIPPHLSFTLEEELRGKVELEKMGIPEGAEFICLIARDNAYLKTVFPNVNVDYHNYRDVDIRNYVLAAEALADRGYYVIRMGSLVKAPIASSHPQVIDYATNGMRCDFMDMYLGAKCFFCISCGTGFDAIPLIFRRPIAYVSMVPTGKANTAVRDTVFLSKKHWLASEQRWLSLKEIFSRGLGFCESSSEYEAQGVQLVENTPEEIASLVIEMLERLKGKWQPEPGDVDLQRRFWEIFPVDSRDPYQDRPMHGTIRARYGAQFLRANREWLA